MKKIDYAFFPQIKLDASYKTNDYDADSGSTAFKEGVIGSKHKESSVGVTVTWPIGFKSDEVEKAKVKVQLSSAQMEQQKLKRSFEQNVSFLKSRLNLLEINISSALNRVKLANRVLVEYNKLYNLGRADIDQVIRAEEDLINTEKSFVQYLANRDSLLANMATLFGSLKDYVLSCRQ